MTYHFKIEFEIKKIKILILKTSFKFKGEKNKIIKQL